MTSTSSLTDLSASFWVEASAGSGKTKVLTDRVLSLLVSGVSPRSILCLTFTKAAAAEMESRILKTLSTWAYSEKDFLFQTLESLLGKKPTSQECDRAKGLLSIIFDLKIQTIHSFAADILGQFPIEAGLPPTFSLLEEETYQEFLKNLTQILLSDSKNDSLLKECLDIFLPFFSLVSFQEFLEHILENRQKLETFLNNQTHTTSPTKDVIQKFLLETLNDISLPLDSLKKISLIFIKDKESSSHEKGLFLNVFLQSSVEERVKLYPRYLDFFLTQQKKPRINLLPKIIKEQEPSLFENLNLEQSRLLRLEETLKDLYFNVFNQAFFKLSSYIFDRYLSFKQEKNSYDYTDLLLKTRDLLKDSEKSPWVFYQLNTTIDHVLLDEAQDTSSLQWEILTLLFTHLKENTGEVPKTLFVVGDEKQSIYSFQGADPEIFQHHQSLFERLTQTHNESWHVHKLDISYRSTETVLKTVDAIFSSKNVSEGVSIKEKISHQAFRIGHPGRVEIWPLLTPKMKENFSSSAVEFGDFSHTQSTTPSHPERILAQTIAEHIEHLIGKKEILSSTKKPIHYGDILILVRRRTLLIEELIYFLKNKGIPVVGQDRILLKNHLGIQDLLALAHWSLFPDDDLNLAVVLKGPFFSFSEENLFHICWGREGSLLQSLKEKSDQNILYEQTIPILEEMLFIQKGTGPFAFFNLLLTHFNGRQFLLEHFGQEINDILDEFLSLIYDLEQTKGLDLNGCIHWIQKTDKTLKRNLDTQNPNHVRIMTVHGSKGLEAPFVILPDTTTTPRNLTGFSICWKGQIPVFIPPKEFRPYHVDHLLAETQKKNLEEYRRLLYVALTRAQDHLLIAGFVPTIQTSLSPESWWSIAHDALKQTAKPTFFSFLENSRNAWGGEGFVLESAKSNSATQISQEKAPPMEKFRIPSWVYEQASQDLINTFSISQQEDVSHISKEALERGELLHLLLEKLPSYSESSWPQISCFLLKQENSLSILEKIDLQQKVFSILKNPTLQFLFGPNTYGEIPLLGNIHGSMLSARLDRLVVGKDSVWIVDYKSDKTVPLSPSLVPKPYLKQLLLYYKLLKPLYLHRSIKLGILWIETESIMEIPSPK